MTILDRTNEPLPLSIDEPTDMSSVVLIDRNPLRPAIVKRAPLKIHKIVGLCDGNVYRPEHGPRLFSKLEYSHHDGNECRILDFGGTDLECHWMEANVGCLVLPYEDGTYGKGGTYKIRYLRNHVFGVLASGQEDFTLTINDSKGFLWPDPDRKMNSHAVYLNRCMFNGKFMRMLRPKVRIGKSRAVAKATEGMHPTMKATGAWGLDYECMDDQNAGGAGDFSMCSGFARIGWKHPGGDFQNPVFALRLTDRADFGTAPAYFGVSGSLDGSLCPDKTKNVVAVHCLDGRIASLGVSVKGKVDVYGAAASLFPMDVEAIVKQ